MRSFARLAVLMVGLASLALPAGPSAPSGAQCTGGVCDICPAVATVVAATGETIYCIA